jgi:hypothetical protein
MLLSRTVYYSVVSQTSRFDQNRPVFENSIPVKSFNSPYFQERPGIFRTKVFFKMKKNPVFWKNQAIPVYCQSHMGALDYSIKTCFIKFIEFKIYSSTNLSIRLWFSHKFIPFKFYSSNLWHLFFYHLFHPTSADTHTNQTQMSSFSDKSLGWHGSRFSRQDMRLRCLISLCVPHWRNVYEQMSSKINFTRLCNHSRI